MTRFLVPTVLTMDAADEAEARALVVELPDVMHYCVMSVGFPEGEKIVGLCDHFEGNYENPSDCDETAVRQVEGFWYCEPHAKHYEELAEELAKLEVAGSLGPCEFCKDEPCSCEPENFYIE
jgi:hypothetical protein